MYYIVFHCIFYLNAFSTILLTPFDDTSERLVEPPSNEQPSPKINLKPRKIPVLTTRPLFLPNLSPILTQHELRSKIPVRITSCRSISNFPISTTRVTILITVVKSKLLRQKPPYLSCLFPMQDHW